MKPDACNAVVYNILPVVEPLELHLAFSTMLHATCCRNIASVHHKQSCVALSVAETEYLALSSAAQEAICSGKLLYDLNFGSNKPCILYVDNQAAISLAKDPFQI